MPSKARLSIVIRQDINRALGVYCGAMGQTKNTVVTEAVIRYLEENKHKLTEILDGILSDIKVKP